MHPAMSVCLRAIGIGAVFVAALAAKRAVPAAVLFGRVSDANGVPIPNAEVSLPTLQKSALANDSGRYRITDVPPGSHSLHVRRIGFQEQQDEVVMPATGSVEYNFVLRPAQVLAPVQVTADPFMTSFEENRRIGLGRFMTRAQLEPMEHRKLGDVIEQVGARVKRVGPAAWVSLSRGSVRSFNDSPRCAQLESFRQLQERERNSPRVNPGCGCFAIVYLDDKLLYDGNENSLIPNINLIAPGSLEAIEFYKGPAQTPMKYSRLNSQCGVLVLHTRRTPGTTKKPDG